MPHIIFEYSNNIIEVNFLEILKEIHLILAKQLPAQLYSCKSRIIKHQDYLIGDGALNNAFVHVTIDVLPGRDKDLLYKVAENIISMLQIKLKESLIKLDLQISVSIKNLPEVYHKSSNILK